MPESLNLWNYEYDRPDSPSWTTKISTVEVRQERYTNVACAKCQAALRPVFDEALVGDEWTALQAEDALRVSLSGAYGEMLDTPEGPREAYLCRECAINLLECNPWMLELAAPALNINVGHRCGGTIAWVAESACETDPNRHGWRTIWYVSDAAGAPEAAIFDTREEAEQHAANMGGTVTSSILAHARNWSAQSRDDSANASAHSETN